jgi:hypothetical protein
MTVRSVVGVLFVVMVLAVSAIELSTWLLGRAMSAIVPAASVSEVNAEMPQAPEIDAPEPVAAPALTW